MRVFKFSVLLWLLDLHIDKDRNNTLWFDGKSKKNWEWVSFSFFSLTFSFRFITIVETFLIRLLCLPCFLTAYETKTKQMELFFLKIRLKRLQKENALELFNFFRCNFNSTRVTWNSYKCKQNFVLFLHCGSCRSDLMAFSLFHCILNVIFLKSPSRKLCNDEVME